MTMAGLLSEAPRAFNKACNSLTALGGDKSLRYPVSLAPVPLKSRVMT